MDSPRPPMTPVTRTILFAMPVFLLDSFLLSCQALLTRFLLHVPTRRRLDYRVLRISKFHWGRLAYTGSIAQPRSPVLPPAAGVLRCASKPPVRIRIDR